MKTAIMIDGGFFYMRANELWGKENDPAIRVSQLMRYCEAHLALETPKADLYRIFYYDCPPLECSVKHPLTKKDIKLGSSYIFTWMMQFHNELLKQRKLALRRGRLAISTNIPYTLRPQVQIDLLEGRISPTDLKEKHFMLSSRQKGVDMKLGIDVASIAYKRQVSQIVLIAGDSDFVPAAKVARREGIDFILDSMGNHINADLEEHIDGWRSPIFTP